MLVVDACGLLSLLATGHELEIVEALDCQLVIPEQLRGESGPLGKSARMHVRELDLEWIDDFVACAELLADKDAACAALAGFTGLPLVTDDPKVKRVTRERYASVRLISTLEFVVDAVQRIGLDEGEIAYSLRWRGNFVAPRGDERRGWFEEALRRGAR